jgi:hypothetical protein
MTALVTSADDFWSFVDELSRNIAAVGRLLAEHVPVDGLCAVCTRPGTGTRHVEWPCPTAAIALMARERGNR